MQQHISLRQLVPRNPKRTGTEPPVHINWFPYYAGYSSGFVVDVLRSLRIQPQSVILDPWNGSGTTTTTAYRMGANVIGCDINPVMVVAAKSALLDPGTTPSLVPLAEELLHVAKSLQLSGMDDPLTTWYGPTSAGDLRGIHHAIWKVLVNSHTIPTSRADEISELSTIAAFFLTALFRTTRSLLRTFVGSNPTWIRLPKTSRHRIRPSQEVLFRIFRHEVAAMSQALLNAMESGLKIPLHRTKPTIKVATSTALPFDDGSVQTVVTSPPYLTRIDYAVATKPELATLGISLSDEFNGLRKSMLGAPAIRDTVTDCAQLGDSCSKFLRAVSNHPSKGSVNYYYKFFMQYLSDMSRSLAEIARLLAKKGTCVLVVQDSYYKEVRADLAQFVTEIGGQMGLKLIGRNDFEWNRNMIGLNSRARRYRTSAAAVESVLWFSKQ